MPSQAPGRNDPCPCGSGKKYKKCCGPKAVAGGGTAPAAPSSVKAHSHLRWGAIEADVVERLDEVSNAAMDAIQERRYEAAEKLCELLLRDYPEIVDGHDRLAKLRTAQGRYGEAAEHYAHALEIIGRHREDYDPEVVTFIEERRQEALAKARPQT